mgnify:CR=1 FL=1
MKHNVSRDISENTITITISISESVEEEKVDEAVRHILRRFRHLMRGKMGYEYSIMRNMPADHMVQDDKKEVLYLCDGEKADCKKKHCYKETAPEDPDCCRHTADVAHAIHFKLNRTGRIYVEEPRQKNTTVQISKE